MPRPTASSKACRREPVDRLPVWMMRQAGRYQPSLPRGAGEGGLPRAVPLAGAHRAGDRRADRRVRVRRGDPLLGHPRPPAGDGARPLVREGREGQGRRRAEDREPGPHARRRRRADGPRPAAATSRTCSTASAASARALAGRVPLIGFVGGPFTVASYVGRGREPGLHPPEDDALADPHGGARALREAHAGGHRPDRGADRRRAPQAAQIFESWLGELAREDLEEFSFPYLARIAEAVREDGRPGDLLLDRDDRPPRAAREARLRRRLASTGACRSTRRAPRVPGMAVQGNLDSTLLLGPKETAVARAPSMLAAPRAASPVTSSTSATASRPATPPENVKARRGRGPRVRLEVRQRRDRRSRPAELIQKYDRPGPRYTSYPTAPEWTDAFGPRAVRGAPRARGPADGPALDLRAPPVLPGDVPVLRLQRRRDARPHAAPTPTSTSSSRRSRSSRRGCPTGARPHAAPLGRRHADLPRREAARALPRDPRAPLRVHRPTSRRRSRSTPPSRRARRSTLLARLGFNRISMGVQDFDAKVQEVVGRIQGEKETADLVAAPRATPASAA